MPTKRLYVIYSFLTNHSSESQKNGTQSDNFYTVLSLFKFPSFFKEIDKIERIITLSYRRLHFVTNPQKICFIDFQIKLKKI